MSSTQDLLANNRAWAEKVVRNDPAFFQRLTGQQSPRYLWIGCSDSRVPANDIVGLLPGELLVHRNVANVVVHSDLNCLSVLQYACDVLRVEHVIVCGHYGCGGVEASLQGVPLGLIDNWLRHVQAVAEKHAGLLGPSVPMAKQGDRLCELNVLEQALHVAQTTVVQDAWRRGQSLSIHGWIYRLQDGLLRDLGLTITGSAEVRARHAAAVTAVAARLPA
jgi:carbonic anhydrase